MRKTEYVLRDAHHVFRVVIVVVLLGCLSLVGIHPAQIVYRAAAARIEARVERWHREMHAAQTQPSGHVDRSAAGTFAIGTTNATAITIGSTGTPTTIQGDLVVKGRILYNTPTNAEYIRFTSVPRARP